MSAIYFNKVFGFATLQDQGRIGVAHIAVPTSGAFDQHSHRMANRLVQNSPDVCVIESLRSAIEFKSDSDLVIAVTGAPVSIQIDSREQDMFCPLYIPANATVRLTPSLFGMRTYLAVRGGILGNQIMGSAAFDELSQIGTPPIVTGMEFAIGNESVVPIPGVFVPSSGASFGESIELEVVPAPRWSRFSNPQALLTNQFEVTSAINRVGMRLSGKKIDWDTTVRLPSEGVVIGAIQVLADGLPLIFGPDHPTTAGYPVIAVVSRKSLNVLAQTAPGTKVRFVRAR